MRKLYILSLACVLSLFAQAQITHKLGLKLYTELQKPENAKSSVLKHIMVLGDPSSIRSLVERYKGIYKYSSGTISSVAIPYKNLMAFSREKDVARIESYEARGHAMMDSARIRNNIDSVQLGYAPLAQSYTGSGVLIGIIDGGIYFSHHDFRRANGNTRILYMWDQTDNTSTLAQPFGYGTDWDSTAINGNLCREVDPISDYSHGTNVAGIAAGNGSSFPSDSFLKRRYVGTAPDADMIVVKVDYTRPDFLQAVTDAVAYIFDKADQLGRPCVVNTSLGTYYGSHDGNELTTLAIDSMLDAKKGRVVVAAAGNAGNIKFHLSYPLSATDSLFSWFSYNTASHQVDFDMWADSGQIRQANFALGCDSSTVHYLGRTRYMNVLTDFNPGQGLTVQKTDSLMNGSTKLGDYTIAVTLTGTLYHIEFIVNPVKTTYLWRLQTMGQGTFDGWASSAAIGNSNIVNAPLPGGFTSPNYRYGDSLKTLVSAWQCSDKVITVGNYSNRSAYLKYDSTYLDLTVAPYNEIVGSLFSTSSIGPTRDGRMKPDITATGATTTATADSAVVALFFSTSQSYKVSYGSKHMRNGGTSMSSPIVAGIAALYLQKHPNATYKEVKQVLEVTAKIDTFTTYNIPNVRFGYGKVNAFQALKYNVVYGCQDTGSINYNAAANIDTGGCIPKIYGCTDTGSINYSATANTSNGSCIQKVYGITDSACVNYNRSANVSNGICQYAGITEALNADISFDVIPTPFSSSAMIQISSSVPLVNASVRFYDMLGKQVDAIAIPLNTSQIAYNNTRLSPGIYDAAIVSENKVIAVRKIVVE